ncbi:hypothetical protein GCM10025791_21920 [Halioxenophilus aromaticivorans]|uniref:Uncharacterized protein n=1 Tax=Halioxenophilus aromaticivorans TaxID=1306992 RepID=A0AAV3U239_9ALTE
MNQTALPRLIGPIDSPSVMQKYPGQWLALVGRRLEFADDLYAVVYCSGINKAN